MSRLNSCYRNVPPERHTLFTSLTLFNPFFVESCQTVSGSGFAKKKKQTNKKDSN